MLFKLTVLLASLAAWVVANDGAPAVERRADSRPNIIFILTDDQDNQMNSLDYMGGVQKHLISEGALYQHHYCTVALCCPSRVNLWTGRAAHNTNVTDLQPPYGGYDKFIKQGFNKDWLPVWMQNAGYNTYYVGKLMNSFDEKNYDKPTPAGFNGSDFLCGGGTYNYYNPQYQRNIQGKPQAPKKYPNQYTTDLTFNKSMAFLDDARKAGGPFFLTMATVAPHDGNGKRPPNTPDYGPVPKAEYAHLFNDVKVPRTKNFNPDKPSGTSWLLDIAQLNQTEIDRNDNYYQQRLRALQSVDDLVNGTIAYLTEHNLLDNTYIIYSADNGFHISQHRLFPGKNCPYEEDINVPMVIRGPGVKAGSTVNVATSHTDVAPTILQMAGGKLPAYLDGAPVPMIAQNVIAENFEHAQIEHWGDAGSDDTVYYPNAPGVVNTTYKALRVMGTGYDYYYSVWCSNQHELYNMTVDPGQLENLFEKYSYKPSEPATNPWAVNRLESRLDALLLVLKSCKAQTCIKPWLALHPAGDVTSLVDAMKPKYDEFYEKTQNRVSFDYCAPGYIIAAEGPQSYHQFKSTQNRMAHPLSWSM